MFSRITAPAAFLALLFGTALASAQASFDVVASFPQTTALPAHGVVRASNGLLYGLARFGGSGDAGALFEVNETTGAITTQGNFASIGGEIGSEPLGLAVDAADTIYGVTPYGGATGDGTLWKWDATGGLVRLANFTATTTGEKPHCNVVWQASANTLFGVCEAGGAYAGGTLWKWTAAGGLVRLYSFQNYGDALSLGGRPQCLALNGSVLYGVGLERDPATQEVTPTLWARSATGTMSQAAVFDTDTVGFPMGALLPSGTGVVGVAYASEATSGTPRLWRYQGAKKITVLHTFAAADADVEMGINDTGKVCGTTQAGQIWRWSPTLPFAKIGTLSPAAIGEPVGQLIVKATGDILGTALRGTDGAGTLWKWSGSGTGEVVAAFDGLPIGGDPNGLWLDSQGSIYGVETIKQLIWRWSPASGPVPTAIADVEHPLIGFVTFGGVVGDNAGNLYGFTRLGVAGDAGVLWQWNARTGIEKIGKFGTVAVPGNATGAIVRASDGTLYGTTVQRGGATQRTHVWQWTSADGLSKLASLAPADGGAATESLALSPDDTLYGTCSNGGADNLGTLWAWSAAEGIQKLADFDSAIATPGSGLAVSTLGTVYGVSRTGGVNGDGLLWKWKPLLGLSIVQSFNYSTSGSMAQKQNSGLLLAGDGNLYGTTVDGGSHGVGTFWRCNASNASPTLTVLHAFDPTVMAHPSAQRLAQDADGAIYGLGLHGIWRYGLAPVPHGPAAVTLDASYLSATRVILEGSVNALNVDAEVTFEYGTDPALLDQIGTPGTSTVTGTDPTPVSCELTGLLPGTYYFYRVVATNADGTSYGDIEMLRTSATLAPLVVTQAADTITTEGFTLNASVTPKGDLDTAVAFELGTSSTALDTVINAVPATATGITASSVSADATGLLAHTKYYFRAVASNDNGSAKGGILFATTRNNPPEAIDDDALVLPSGQVTIPVTDNDTDADSDTLSILAFTQPPVSAGKVTKSGTSLVFTAAATFITATFSYTISDGFSGTSTASVTVTRDTASLGETRRTVASAGETYEVSITTASGWAAISGVPWLVLTPARGTGDGLVSVRVLPTAAAASRIGTIVIGGIAHTVTQNGVLPPTVEAPAPIPGGMISSDYQLIVPTTGLPVTYLVTNLPPGLRLTASGRIEGRPTKTGDFLVIVKASNIAGIATTSFTIRIKPLPDSHIGSFTALFARHSLNRELGGLLKLTTTSAGILTGTLKNGADTYPLTDRIDSIADASAPNTSTLTLPRKGQDSLLLIITFDPLGATNAIAATLAPVGSSDPAANATGARHTWGGSTASAYAASYNTFLELSPSSTSFNLPLGTGFITYKVLATGAATWIGKLSDGTVTSGSNTLWPDASLPLWQTLYVNTGSVFGSSSIATAPTSTVSGSLDWLRKPQVSPTERKYRSGFGPLTLNNSGVKYTPPSAGGLLLSLNLTDTLGNARLTFTQALLADADQGDKPDQILRITLANKAELAPLGTANNLTSVKLNLVASTGSFTGSFILRDSNPLIPSRPFMRTVSFEGLIVPSHTKGAGYFLLSELPTTSTLRCLSGNVVLDRVP